MLGESVNQDGTYIKIGNILEWKYKFATKWAIGLCVSFLFEFSVFTLSVIPAWVKVLQQCPAFKCLNIFRDAETTTGRKNPVFYSLTTVNFDRKGGKMIPELPKTR